MYGHTGTSWVIVPDRVSCVDYVPKSGRHSVRFVALSDSVSIVTPLFRLWSGCVLVAVESTL